MLTIKDSLGIMAKLRFPVLRKIFLRARGHHVKVNLQRAIPSLGNFLILLVFLFT